MGADLLGNPSSIPNESTYMRQNSYFPTLGYCTGVEVNYTDDINIPICNENDF